MTQYHIVRVQDVNGAVNYHRHEDDFINPDYWEHFHWDRYRKEGGTILHSVICINVYKGQE
jgi:hypothetical protein